MNVEEILEMIGLLAQGLNRIKWVKTLPDERTALYETVSL